VPISFPVKNMRFARSESSLAPHRIKLLKHVRMRKWQAKWIKPNAGLIDYVSTEQILVPWKEQTAFLKEERDRQVMWEHNLKRGFEGLFSITLAVYTVIENAGEDIHAGEGDIAGTLSDWKGLKTRARLDSVQLCEISHCYTDRSGRLHLPFEKALDLARAFCTSEPSGVLADIKAEERKWSFIATGPGEEYQIPLLNI